MATCSGASCLAAIATSLLAVAVARAEPIDAAAEPPWRASLVANAGWKGYFGGRYSLNPRSGAVVLGVRHRHLYRTSPQRILDGAALQVGAVLAYSIATARTALYVEWQPLAVVRVRLQYETWLWTGADLGL